MSDALRLADEGVRSLESWLPLVQETLRQRPLTPATTKKAVNEATLLFRYVGEVGVTSFDDVTREMVTDWCYAPRPDRSGKHRSPSVSTIRNRQWLARTAFEALATLGVPVDSRELVGDLLSREQNGGFTRPMTEWEVDQVKAFADTRHYLSRGSLMVGFGLSGGDAAEIGFVRRRDVDLSAATVTFRGAKARTNPLDKWSAETVELWLHNNPEVAPGDLLCVSHTTDSRVAAQRVNARLCAVFSKAGFSDVSGVSARSLRLTGARRVLDAHGIEAAALFLGSLSLDGTALALQYEWW